MKQNFILERQDMDTLKNGGNINLSFAGGHVILSAEKTSKYTIDPAWRLERRGYRQKIVEFLKDIRRPAKAAEIADAVSIDRKCVHDSLYALRVKKMIVNSDAGWRTVFDTATVKPKKLPTAKVSTNGHSKSYANAN